MSTIDLFPRVSGFGVEFPSDVPDEIFPFLRKRCNDCANASAKSFHCDFGNCKIPCFESLYKRSINDRRMKTIPASTIGVTDRARATLSPDDGFTSIAGIPDLINVCFADFPDAFASM